MTEHARIDFMSKTLDEMMAEIQSESVKRYAMIQRISPDRGRHRHMWEQFGSGVPITRKLRIGRKYATRYYECIRCGATKYKNRNGTSIIRASI